MPIPVLTSLPLSIKMLQAIPVHQDAARKTAAKFHELGKKVEVFPLKVSSYLREEAEAGGFWWNLWTGVEEYVLPFPLLAERRINKFPSLCMSIWNVRLSVIICCDHTGADLTSRHCTGCSAQW